jgi:glycosyltransferase involved in cell wall biosynthesis
MKNILYIFSTLKKSGPINIILNILKEIDRNRFNPIVLSLSENDENEISAENDLKDLNIRIFSLNLNRFTGFLVGKKKILDFCKSNKIETIHLIGFRADLLVQGRKFKDYTIVSSIFSNLFDDYSMLYGTIKGSIMAYIHLHSLDGKIKVACSKFVSDKLKSWVDDDFKIIKNSVSQSTFVVPTLILKSQIRKNLNIDNNKKVFIFVGVLIDRKDPLTTIRAFLNSKICQRNEAILIVLGDGPLRYNCEMICENTDSVIFMGNTYETLTYLQASDYYIASSHSEGLPTSVIEALSCGLIPLLSFIKPHIEVTSSFTSKPFLFPVGNAEVLSKMIDDVIDENYEVFSKQSRLVVETELNSILMSMKYQSLY